MRLARLLGLALAAWAVLTAGCDGLYHMHGLVRVTPAAFAHVGCDLPASALI